LVVSRGLIPQLTSNLHRPRRSQMMSPLYANKIITETMKLKRQDIASVSYDEAKKHISIAVLDVEAANNMANVSKISGEYVPVRPHIRYRLLFQAEAGGDKGHSRRLPRQRRDSRRGAGPRNKIDERFSSSSGAIAALLSPASASTAGSRRSQGGW